MKNYGSGSTIKKLYAVKKQRVVAVWKIDENGSSTQKYKYQRNRRKLTGKGEEKGGIKSLHTKR